MKPKILCLGNEFIKQDSLAKKIAGSLDYDFVFIKDSFQLMEILKSAKTPKGVPPSTKAGGKIIILDVVEGLDKVCLLDIDDLKQSNILTAHDFDAGFLLKLLGDGLDVKIVGVPMIAGDEGEVGRDVRSLLDNIV